MASRPSSEDSAIAVDYVALAPDRMVGRYRIAGVLGQGGFGITYRARDTQLGRDVAIKEYLPVALAVRHAGSLVLPRSTAAAEDFAWGRQRFIDEGRTLANLHEAPSIVKVFDFLEENGTAYIVMELLRGETLEQRVRRSGGVTPDQLDAFLWPLLSGLLKVHEAGFLHRDIKPANILLGDEGRPTLIDFGASRAAMADRTATMTAVFTPGYAAPEQFSAAGQGPWTDIYGLAATLYFAITGQPPPNAIDRMMDDRLQPLGQGRRPGFAPGLMAGIDAGLALPVRERPQSVGAWRATLTRPTADGEATLVMRRGASPRALPRARPAPPAKPPRRRRSLGVAGILAIILVAGGANHFFGSKPAPPTERTAPAAAAQPIPDQTAQTEQQRAAAAALAEKQRQEEEARKASAEAAKKRLEDEARQKAAQAEAARRLEERRRAEEAEARARADRAAPAAPEPAPSSAAPTARPSPSATAAAPASAWDGVYAGSLSVSSQSGGMAGLTPLAADLRVAGGQVTGQLIRPGCGPMDVTLAIAPSGAISGTVRLYEAVACSGNSASVTGKMGANGLTLEIRGINMSARGTLSRRTD